EVEKSARSLLLFASLVYGLALGVHHVTILLTFPAIFVLVYLTVGKEYIFSKRLLLLFVALFIGLSIYIYLPFAASRETIINWGNPKTFANFYDHISGKQYQVNLFSSGMDKVSEELSQFLRIIFQEFTLVGLLVGLFGFFAVWQKEKRLFWFVTLIIFFDLAYSFNYDIAEDKDAYYLITHFAFTLVIAVGARYMLDVASRKNGLVLLSLLVLLLLLPCLNFYTHYFRNNRSNYTIAYDYVKNSLSSIEEGGLLLTADWQMYSPYLYMRHLENFRKDATVIDTNLLRRSWYVEIYLKREYPEMMKACANEVEAYMKDLRLFEQDLPYDIPAINRNYFAMVEAFIKFHTPKHSAHITLPIDDGVGRNYTWVPQGLTMLLSSSKEFIPSYPNIDLKSISDSSQYIDQVAEEKVVPRYSMMFINRGRYLNLHNKNDEALKFIELAIRLEPERDAAYEALGDVYTAMGNQTEALKAYRNALEINPNNREVIKKLQRQ
ncbi:MAG: tetratricopeptide repeat protein, partial [Blastocatellia bacterium]|nr:tetratricopeptide repeat protein [Blastocatellia bacterium]